MSNNIDTVDKDKISDSGANGYLGNHSNFLIYKKIDEATNGTH